jgi:hypothetical protein
VTPPVKLLVTSWSSQRAILISVVSSRAAGVTLLTGAVEPSGCGADTARSPQ